MTYKFLLCQPDKRFPDTQGWYLELRPGDLATLMEVHIGIARFYCAKFGPLTPEKLGCNPLDLTARWVSIVQQQLMADITLVIGSSGGWLPKSDVVVVAERESDKLVWPTVIEGETITLKRWPGGIHWYLCSSVDRIFAPNKHRTYEAAYEAARVFVSEDCINGD